MINKKPEIVQYLDELNEKGLLKKSVQLGLIKPRTLRARIAWNLVNIGMLVHGLNKTDSVETVAEDMKTSVRDIHRLISEISDQKKRRKRNKKRINTNKVKRFKW